MIFVSFVFCPAQLVIITSIGGVAQHYQGITHLIEGDALQYSTVQYSTHLVEGDAGVVPVCVDPRPGEVQ